MFNNQLSSKELYSTNPSQFLQRSGFRNDQDDSAISSSQTMSQCNSQMMSSQMDNSQSSSFDMFSQMMLSQQQGSLSQQTENSNISQRFYTKYMSKAPLFTKESDRNPSSMKRDFQEQFESNKQKARERDNRDLINTFINLVKECTEEVKSAATGIQRDVDKNITDTASQFGSLIQKINEDLSQFHQSLLGAMKVREDHQTTLEGMQQDIATRDAKIEVLEMQLESLKQQRDEGVVQSLLEAYTDQQKMNRDHIDKVQEEQQTFCKMQMEHLKEEQRRYLLRRELEEEAAGAARAAVSTSGRDGLGNGLVGLKAPVIDIDRRSHSWQGVSQSRHVDQCTSGFQQNSAKQNLMNQVHPITSTSHHKDAVVSHMVRPTGASLSNQGDVMPLPNSSITWSVPLDLHNRETPLQSDISCSSAGYSFNQSSVAHGIQHAIPDAQMMVNNFVQSSRPSGFILPQGAHHAARPMMSPQFTSNQSGQWNSNKLRPSPVATVAPRVQPKEAIQPRQVEMNDERVETIEPATTAVAKKKRGRNRYEVAVKSKRQSARNKAKLNNTSSETHSNTNQPQCKQRACHISKRAPKPKSTEVEATQQNLTKSLAPHQALMSAENVWKKSVSGRERAPSKKKMEKKQSCQLQPKPSSQKQENKPPQKNSRQKTNKIDALKHPPQVKVSQQKPTVADVDVYEYTEPEEEKITRKVRGKQDRINRCKVSTSEKLDQKPPQEDIFSQKKVSTYMKHQIGEKFGCSKSSASHFETSQDKQISHHASQHQACQLDTMLPYSNDEDSSEELIFSLKLPNSPWHKTPSLQKHAEKSRQAGEQVVPCMGSPDLLSTPRMQVLNEEDSTVTGYSVCVKSGQKMSRQTERKRRLIHSSAAVVEITNSLRLQHHKVRRVSSCH